MLILMPDVICRKLDNDHTLCLLLVSVTGTSNESLVRLMIRFWKSILLQITYNGKKNKKIQKNTYLANDDFYEQYFFWRFSSWAIRRGPLIDPLTSPIELPFPRSHLSCKEEEEEEATCRSERRKKKLTNRWLKMLKRPERDKKNSTNTKCYA